MTATPRHDTPTGLLRILAAAVTWGTIPLVLSAVGAVSPFVIVFWRVAMSGAVMLAVAAVTGEMRAIAAFPRRQLGALMLNGVLLGLNWVLFFSGMRLAGVAVGEILGYMGPVFVAALTPLVVRVPFDRKIVLPLALALGGTIAVLSATLSGASFGPNVALGALLAAASSLTYSLLILNSKRLLAGVSTVALMLVEDATAALVLLPAVLLLPGPTTAREWGALVVLSLVHTVLTGLLFVGGLRHVRADHAAILTYAEPVSAVAFGAWLLGQPVTPLVVLGGAAVVAGGVLVARAGTGYGQEAPVAADS